MKAIACKYIGPTNTKGARVKASDCDGNSAIVAYDSSVNRDAAFDNAARALCKQMGWGGKLIRGWLGNEAIYVFQDGRESIEIV